MSSGNLLFLLVLLFGPLVSVSSCNWVMCWVGLELSFFGAVPMLLSDSGYFSLSKESVIKYFCIQAMGSGMLMVGGMMFYMSYSTFWIWDVLFLGSLCMKLGIFPLHFWVPSVVAGLNWLPMLILLTWQKIGPFAFMMSIIEGSSWILEMSLIFGTVSALMGSIIGLNQTSVRAMLGSSSVAHTGWGMVGAALGSLWIFFTIYCLSFGLLMLFFSLEEDLMIGLSILSLSGLPPFMMFIGKWSILKSVLYNGFSWLFLLFLILGSFLSLFFYLKFFYSYYLGFLCKGSSNKKFFSLMSTMMLMVLGSIYILFAL
uniref:NADH-ubiquinone oxidoreductase chain 2 n=1 Tax=Hypselodoris apolegma TaxID=1174615 RepID=A0A343RAM2_9GAST|nr:NADH dehydrogenase subunit 2 [Hypselodoris apolegma]ATX68390.1 NADH dehydrogenase subunit 2 [Hypselodoris apolegma]